MSKILSKTFVSCRAVLGAASLLAFLADAAAPVPARAVDCPPGEPAYVYLDVGNDGCFQAGTDTQIPDASLFSFFNVNGTVVVPAKVKVTAPDGTAASWYATGFVVRGTLQGFASLSTSGISAQVASTGKLSAGALSLGASIGGMVLEDGVSLEATAGQLNVSSGSTLGIGAGSTLTGNSVSLNAAGSLEVGEAAAITATGGTNTLNSSADIHLGPGVSVLASGNQVYVSNTGARLLDDGVSIEAIGGSASLNGGGPTTIGNNVKIAGDFVNVSGAADIVAGDKLVVTAAMGSVSMSGGGAVLIGDKAKISATGGIGINPAGDIGIGAGAKLTAEASVGLTCAASVTIGEKAKLTSTGSSLTLQGLPSVSIGAKGKLNAGTAINLNSFSLSAAPGMQIGEGTKVRSGTLADPMAPSTITVYGYAITVAPKTSFSGGDRVNSIQFRPYHLLSIDGAKLSAKQVVVGYTGFAPFPTFSLTNVKAGASADMATFNFEAAGTTCDLTGSSFKGFTLDNSTCAAVVGP